MIIVALAVIVKGPLSRVPENSIKFAVGVLLASFGTFWGAEGAGAHWPGSDASLLVIIPLVALASCALTLEPPVEAVLCLQRYCRAVGCGGGGAIMSSVAGAVRSFFAFWWDFIIGDDVSLAVGVVLGIAAVAAIHEAGVASWWALPVVWVVALSLPLRRATCAQAPETTGARS